MKFSLARISFPKRFFTVKVAQTTRRPNVRHIILLDQLEDEIVLLLRLNRNGIHAVLAADVTCFQPVDALCCVLGHMATVEVVVAFVVEFLGT